MVERVAVIGAGIIGLSTARALTRRGFEVSVYENGAPGGGQSAGESRIFRHAHADERQFELALRARRDWQELEQEFGVQLISPDGSMVIGQEGVDLLARYAGDPGVEVRELGSDDVAAALPVLARFEGPAMIDMTAGAIRTRLTLANLIRLVGTDLVPDHVDAVIPLDEGGVDIVGSTTGRTRYAAAVVCAGVGTTTLAEMVGVRIPVEAKAHVRLTLPVGGAGRRDRLACIQDSSGSFGEPAAYGSPIRGNGEYAVGLPVTADVGSEAGGRSLIELADRTHAYVYHAFPELDAQPTSVVHCWVTELPWAEDGLAMWQAGDAYFVAGHNLFKFAPALAKTLARSVLAGEIESGFRASDRLGATGPEPVRPRP